MGDTKDLTLQRGLKFARFVTAVLAGLSFMVAIVQLVFFQNIKISFQVGVDAQQVESIKIKKGSNVELPSPMKPGSYFMGWSLSPTSAEVIEDSTHLMKNTTLYAVWDGAEKYAVLSVNGLPYGEVNIFDTSVEGVTPAQLNAKWRVLDDFAEDPDGTRLTSVMVGAKTVKADLRNNFSRFLGWQYLNMYGRYNELRYEADATGTAGTWTLLQRDADGKETESPITDTNKFYPPNYRTTFTALLEYRKVHIKIYDESGNTNYDSENVKLGSAYTFPIFKFDPTLNFSHWEIYGDNNGDYNHNFIDDSDEKQAALIEKLGQVKLRYEGGEILDAVDPLWYYFGSKLESPDGKSTDLVVTLKIRAKYWEKGNNATVHHYSVQPFTDEHSGTEFIDFEKVAWSDLDLEHPVAYEKANHCIWLLVDNKISSYIFYDHKGVYHELTTANLQASLIGGTNKTIGIGIDVEATILGQTIYFKDEWAITIGVKYQTAATTVTLKFSYGDELYLLPDYSLRKNVSASYPRAIGDKFVLPTGENYMKYDYIFTGWQLVGDESGRLYCAGETFTIPNFNTAENSTVIEFVAVWHLQRLLFNFNFMGGAWEDGKEPDFTLMKGAFGDRVRIVMDIPERFGYDFVGWKLDNQGETLQPGTYITIGTEMQTLYAQWEARRLNVMFRLHADASEDNWYSYGTRIEDSRTGGILYSGGYVELPIYNNNDDGADWYIFNGWKIGDKVYVSKDGQRDVKLDTATLLQLMTENRKEYDGTTVLDVYIFADQTRRTVNVEYDFVIPTAENGDVTVPVITSKLKKILRQGELFFNYYPFNVILEDGDYSVFDTGGTQFAGWSYSIDGNISQIAIDANTIVPSGVDHITIHGGLGSQKSFTLVYYDYLGAPYLTDENTYYYNREITLLTEVDNGRSPDSDKWGTFTGWALEPDYEASNPDIIFDVIYYAERFSSEGGKDVVPTLHLSDHLDVNHGPYSINIDQCSTRMNAYGTNYTLRLYAVYSGNYAKATYNYHAGNGNNTELKLPLYSNNDYSRTVIGGSTVGYDSDDFLEQGLVVLDDSTLDVSSSQNFIGWEMLLPDEVSPGIRERFANKIWFPGEFLPSVNFSFEFYPIRLPQHNTNVIEYEIGSGENKRTYRILSLSNAKSKIEINEDVDVVALPRGNYTVPQGTISIHSKREVHVVVPSNGGITLAPRAIQCDTIKEFYVGDKLEITGSPVVGANFEAYRVKKGYRVVGENDEVGQEIIDPSEKYDFESAFTSGLLVSQDRHVLHGVPSHSNLTTEKLLKILKDYPITHIQGYALSDLNNLATINLGINVAKDQTLKIDDFAIFNGTAKEIILPASQQANDNFVIGSQVIAGALRNLTTVTFGTETANPSSTWYAFVNNGFVYYVDNPAQPSSKTHVMYVLPSASLEALDFTTRNLRFESTVTKIEPYALMGRDWTQINSIMVNNSVVDLRNLQGIPNNIPIFTNADNPNRGPMIQPYEKQFHFVYYDSASSYTEKTIQFVYGETFTVFNAQKNKYDFYFDKLWSQFVAWKLKGYSADKLFYVGEVYKVGISEEISGDDYKYELTFNASDTRCWTSYPVQFYAYNPATGKNEAYSPEVFYDLDGIDYSIDDLLTYYNDLGEIYLPAITDAAKRSFTEPVSGAHYQFIGWSTTALDLKKINMWNNISMQQRVLPNHTTTAVLNCGYGYQEGNINIYRYYALYELVTDGLEYEPLNDGTFMVTGGLNNYNITSLHIPFAYYHAGEHENEGYMLPVSKIKDNAFSAIKTTLTEISIGGAVSEIGQSAFYNVKAAQINFAQKGRGIYYNYRQATAVRQLTIGDLAFANNSELTTLVLPVSLETLGSGVFQSCINLVSVKFETGDTSALRVIGDEVFSGDRNMTENAIIPLLTADTKGTRFSSVGAGIFMNTNIRNLTTTNGQVTNKIVWKDTLLYVYYPTGFTTNMTFSESVIAGYAFVNAYSTTDTAMQISLTFTNPNVQIHANAFGYLPKSITSINLRSVKADNVDVNAFDSAITHDVTVVTQNLDAYNTKFSSLLDNNKHYKFS